MATAVVESPVGLSSTSREVFDFAMGAYDARWDGSARLLAGAASIGATQHGVRETAMYALALLCRDAPGDRARAARAVDGVLGQQFDEAGAAYHGTFYRSPQEKRIAPGSKPTVWREYDPNWRHFVGCCWGVILLRFTDRVDTALRGRLVESLVRAVDGEIASGRLVPAYTNIALMHAFVVGLAAQLTVRADLQSECDRYVNEITKLFDRTGTFDEYNSPTYYGVDFFALALWRALGMTSAMREAGASIERRLWLDTARLYHAGLRNQCGPFDRTYGMDMTGYVGLQGLHLRLVLLGERAPFPALGTPMGHAHDLAAAMIYPIVPTQIPPEAMRSFDRFPGEHSERINLGDGRVVTAWLGDRVMIGGQTSPSPKDIADDHSQYRPATIHWRCADDSVGWLALVRGQRIQASAERSRLIVETAGGATFRVHAPNVGAASFSPNRWALSGLTLDVSTDSTSIEVAPHGSEVDVRLVGATRTVIRVA
ncbi:MAG: hypothetical protein QM770_25330 [Tepidisphaeraceae bacterium]